MSRLYDDDDLSIDYEDEMLNFADEAEFDDYLNDEEYELMTSIFAAARRELEEYQGWTNLQVKMALFDHDFDLQSTVVDLKRQLKKRKPAASPISTSQSIKSDSISNGKYLNGKNSDVLTKVSTGLEVLDLDDEEDGNQPQDSGPQVYKRSTIPTKPRKNINLQHYLKTVNPHVSFVVLGHVDAGKSTLMGRLLYEVGAVDHASIRKLKKESENIGKGSFHLAWVMDQTQEERERGVTVSICTSDFSLAKHDFTIVDAPGHRDFVPSAIAGISQADVAILTVDCGINAFESGFAMDGQTKEHMILARSLDIKYLIVAMNKMDTIQWSEERYLEVKDHLQRFLQEIGFPMDKIEWIPCSGFSGEGVHKKSRPQELCNWDSSTSLVETLENISDQIGKPFVQDVMNKPFLLSLLDGYGTSKNNEAMISGKVESGSIQPGESVTIYPSEQSCLVDRITKGRDNNTAPVALKGDFVTIRLKNAHPEDIKAGDLATSVDFQIKSSNRFKLQMLTFHMNRPLLPGTTVIMFRGVYEQPVKITQLISLIDKHDPAIILKNKVKHLRSHQAAIVEIELAERKRWIPMLTYNENQKLGKVVLRKDGRTIATALLLPND